MSKEFIHMFWDVGFMILLILCAVNLVQFIRIPSEEMGRISLVRTIKAVMIAVYISFLFFAIR